MVVVVLFLIAGFTGAFIWFMVDYYQRKKLKIKQKKEKIIAYGTQVSCDENYAAPMNEIQYNYYKDSIIKKAIEYAVVGVLLGVIVIIADISTDVDQIALKYIVLAVLIILLVAIIEKIIILHQLGPLEGLWLVRGDVLDVTYRRHSEIIKVYFYDFIMRKYRECDFGTKQFSPSDEALLVARSDGNQLKVFGLYQKDKYNKT